MVRGVKFLVGTLMLLPASQVVAAKQYADPVGGWTYIYQGAAAIDGGNGNGFTSLDGTWSHDARSDEWDGSPIGSGVPGGVSALVDPDGTTYLRLQDTGDPRDYGFSDPGSNRKIALGHDISAEGASASIIDDGVTLTFRARVATDGPLDEAHLDGSIGIEPWPVEGDGYRSHDGGKGNLRIRQSNGGHISFSLATGDAGIFGLAMNNLIGPEISGQVGNSGVPNFVEVDPVQWNEFFVTIQSDPEQIGTHVVEMYVNGSLEPEIFQVTAGEDNGDFDAVSNLVMAVGSTPQTGAIDIDFFGWAPGVLLPQLAGTLLGDFDASGILDEPDVNALSEQIMSGANLGEFDLTGDGRVNALDLTDWVKSQRKTWFGDANLDGEFNTGDMVQVFSAGKFETGEGATWGQGDWNADGVFNSGDLVAAFSDGGFEVGPVPAQGAVAAVPEPGSAWLLVSGCLALAARRRQSR